MSDHARAIIINAVVQSSLKILTLDNFVIKEYTRQAIVGVSSFPILEHFFDLNQSVRTKLSFSGCTFEDKELILIMGAIKRHVQLMLVDNMLRVSTPIMFLNEHSNYVFE